MSHLTLQCQMSTAAVRQLLPKTATLTPYLPRQQNSEMVFRGRKLILNYTHGSPCGEDSDYYRRDVNNLEPRKEKSNKRRKSTIISLLCETDSLSPPEEATVAFVAASPDECTYFFEARSKAACGGIEKETQQLGPGGVFGVIVLIAFLVYFVGGCVYQRTVMHQRGWRQIPNFSFWESIWRFFTVSGRRVRRLVGL